MRRLSEEEVVRLAGEREGGAEIKELAVRYSIDRSTVITHLHRSGVPGRRRQGRSLSPDRVRVAGELYASGVNLLDVAAQFDVDRRYLRRVLPEAGFALRPPGRRAARGDEA
jgi:transposase